MRCLPIDPLLPRLVETLREAPAVVIQAPPGAGKTTRVPWALLEAGLSGDAEILVTEPRRLAARLAARHVAQEHGESVGATVGYTVRFEDRSSDRTRIRYVTEGVLLRRLGQDPALRGVGVVVLDELHERHLATDVVLALVRRLQLSARSDLKLIAMSATLQAAKVSHFLGDCPCLKSEGRVHPVTIEHLPRPDDRDLAKQVVTAVKRVHREGPAGDVLVFLPGAREISRARDALRPFAESERLDLLPLHGDLPLEQQARAVAPSRTPKVVLATNVAESSVTIDGVTAVVDSGLVRQVTHSAHSGLARLGTGKISRASATQRAGRAGRTRAGRVLRLYTRGDHDHRPEHDVPEIARSDLCEILLALHGLGSAAPQALDWLTPPPPAALSSAETLLAQLGALDADGAITDTGRRMLRFPLHPRLARIVVEGERRGVAPEAALAVALLAERDIRLSARTRFRDGQPIGADASGPSDVLELMDRFEEARHADFNRAALRAMELDSRAVRAVERAERQIERLTREQTPPPDDAEQTEDALRMCLLAGFPDRVARRRRPRERELILSTGTTARLSEQSVVHDAPLMVALDVDERAPAGRSSAAVVRLASAIESDWLLDLFPDLLDATDELEWNADRERVEQVSRVACGSVVLEESRTLAPPTERASQLLARAAQTAGPERFADASEELQALRSKLRMLRDHVPELGWPELGEDLLSTALTHAAAGLTSFEELRAASLTDAVRARLSPTQQHELAALAPAHVTLPGGRRIVVHYEMDRGPWVTSRLQDFFGMDETPRVARGRVALTLHLLAPNQRAVQVTTDLAGFWERHYPTIRRELMRRYPKHPWPEDGRTASPPPPGGRGQRRRRR